MITVIGDSADELANLQSIIGTGQLNSNEKITLDVTFKLSSGDVLLVDRYNHIVGSKKKNNSKKPTTKKDNYDFLMGFDKGDPFCGEGW